MKTWIFALCVYVASLASFSNTAMAQSSSEEFDYGEYSIAPLFVADVNFYSTEYLGILVCPSLPAVIERKPVIFRLQHRKIVETVVNNIGFQSQGSLSKHLNMASNTPLPLTYSQAISVVRDTSSNKSNFDNCTAKKTYNILTLKSLVDVQDAHKKASVETANNVDR